ncbi:hypothetical protein ACFU99_28580 [Streptomyces sp. NPDC057654]|uniref:hypothetical protein n=1 Tax=Streptomyces sp. NPDC057654 TaxID=3346196 RepID=UPI0036D12C73
MAKVSMMGRVQLRAEGRIERGASRIDEPVTFGVLSYHLQARHVLADDLIPITYVLRADRRTSAGAQFLGERGEEHRLEVLAWSPVRRAAARPGICSTNSPPARHCNTVWRMS